MKTCWRGRIISYLLILGCPIFSAGLSRPIEVADSATDVQITAAKLLARAQQLSNIRSANAPSFRVELGFYFTGEDLERVNGSYTEVWLSSTRYRKETTVGTAQQIEIGGTEKRWYFHSSSNLPNAAARIAAMVEMFPENTARYEFESILDRDPSTQCIVTKPGSLKQRHAFCFDKETGLLVEKVDPEFIGERIADYSCKYGHFKKFGDFFFPQEMACYVDKHEKVHANVDELAGEPSAPEQLFQAPAGAVAVARCASPVSMPRATSSPDPAFPDGVKQRQSLVVLWLIVDAEGKPQDVRLAKSGGKRFDEAAIETVRRWRFKPGTCNGEPIATPINVELDFRLYR